jgi:hypothetical protein
MRESARRCGAGGVSARWSAGAVLATRIGTVS